VHFAGTYPQLIPNFIHTSQTRLAGVERLDSTSSASSPLHCSPLERLDCTRWSDSTSSPLALDSTSSNLARLHSLDCTRLDSTSSDSTRPSSTRSTSSPLALHSSPLHCTRLDLARLDSTSSPLARLHSLDSTRSTSSDLARLHSTSSDST
jgi:hypothetical protein